MTYCPRTMFLFMVVTRIESTQTFYWKNNTQSNTKTPGKEKKKKKKELLSL